MAKMKKCSTCGADIAANAKACPQCGGKNKKPIYKRFSIWLLAFFVIVAIAASLGGDGDKQTSTPANGPEMTLAEFNQLTTDMSYEDAVAIIGSEGEVLSETEIAGIKTVMFMWEGKGDLGANSNVMFQNNKLVSKAQFGLK